jgi:hypothetical protein
MLFFLKLILKIQLLLLQSSFHRVKFYRESEFLSRLMSNNPNITEICAPQFCARERICLVLLPDLESFNG